MEPQEILDRLARAELCRLDIGDGVILPVRIAQAQPTGFPGLWSARIVVVLEGGSDAVARGVPGEPGR